MSSEKEVKPMEHKEAFCLMQYESEDKRITELVWNSRDGVTPFGITAKDGATQLYHARWGNDVFSPDHVPQVGERYFVDATRELMTPSLNRYIDKYWDGSPYAMKDRWETKAAAFDDLMKDWIKDGAPWLVTKESRDA